MIRTFDGLPVPIYFDNGGEHFPVTTALIHDLSIIGVDRWENQVVVVARTRADVDGRKGWLSLKLYDLFENRN